MILSRLLRRRGDAGWGDPPDDGIVARLRAAAATDTPGSRQRIVRSRGLVLAEFAASAARADRQAASVPSGPPLPRRLAFATVAATLVLALTAGGIAATGPGLLAYPLRLAVEELLLPADADARLEAQVERLERRLDEARDAAGSPAAVGAALAAYEEIALRLAAAAYPAAPSDGAVAARISAQVRRLERMGSAAAAGSGDALRSAHRLLAWLGAGGPDELRPGQASPASTPSPQPSPRRSQAQRPSPSPTPSPGPQASDGGQGAPGSPSTPSTSPGPSDIVNEGGGRSAGNGSPGWR